MIEEPIKIGNGWMPFCIGNIIRHTKVYGGPIMVAPNDMFTVKMAVEINKPCDVSVDTHDYGVPKVTDLQVGVVRALAAMVSGQTVYAGCMGGIGRTGLFLGALAKVQIEYRRVKHREGRGEKPVEYVRKHFIPHALETAEQERFIELFDVSDIVKWLDATQIAMGLGGVTPPAELPFPANAVNNVIGWATPIEGDRGDLHRAPWKESRQKESRQDVYDYDIFKEGMDSGDISTLHTEVMILQEGGSRHDRQLEDAYQATINIDARVSALEEGCYHATYGLMGLRGKVDYNTESISALLHLVREVLDKEGIRKKRRKYLTNRSWYEKIRSWLRATKDTP